MVISRRRTAANGNVAELYSLAVDSKHSLVRFERNQIRRFRLRIGIGFRIGFAHMHGTGCRHRTVCRRDFGGFRQPRPSQDPIRRPSRTPRHPKTTPRRRWYSAGAGVAVSAEFRRLPSSFSVQSSTTAVAGTRESPSSSEQAAKAQAANAKSKSFFIVRLILSMFVK